MILTHDSLAHSDERPLKKSAFPILDTLQKTVSDSAQLVFI